MADYSALFFERKLVDRRWYLASGVFTGLIVPAGATVLRASMVGGGGEKNGAGSGSGVCGGGAAFARVTAACTPGESLTVQVGQRGNDTALGDSILTRVTGSVVLCKADRGRPSAAGSEANSVGDVKRAGFYSASETLYNDHLRHSGSDLDDTYSLGFGGRKPTYYVGSSNGGGGVYGVSMAGVTGTSATANFLAGRGKVCVEFFTENPGYGA